MQHPVRLLAVALLVLLSGCSLDPQAGEPSPPAAIYLMNADGGGLARVTGETSYDVLPAWSPDARRIAFSRSPRTKGVGEADLFAVDLDGGHEIRLTTGPADDADPAWSPDGERLAFTRYADDAGTVMVVDADGSGLRPLGDIGAGAMPSWSPDGHWLAFISGNGADSQVTTVGADGSGRRVITKAYPRALGPAWSPDGRRIAYVVVSHSEDQDLWVVGADGAGPRRLTSGGADDDHPTWSPDGTRIAFARTAGGSADLHVVGVDGRGEHALAPSPTEESDPAWSPDGRRLAFVRRAGVPVAEPPWWQRGVSAVLGLLVVRLAVGAVVVGVVVCVLKGRPLSGLSGVVAAAAAWVTFTQAPTSRQAERVGGLVLGIVFYGGLAVLLVGVVRRARPSSRWMRLAQRGGREPTRDGSAGPGSSNT